MPIFEDNGRKYNVKDEHINNFLAEFPNSSTIMERNGKKYRVKSADYKAFLEEFDDPIQKGIDAGEITLTMPEPNKPAELPQEANLMNEERKIPGFYQGETDVDTFVQEVEQQRKANEEREARNKAWEEKRKQLYRQGSIADYNQYLEDEIKRVDQEGNLEDKRRMAKILRNESADAYRSYIQANPEIANDPSFMESIGRGLKSTVAGTVGSLINAAASMMGDNYLEEGTGKVLPTNKEDLIRNNMLSEYASKESVDAQPKSAEGGNKGVIDLLREGKVGDALQSAVASGTESAAQSALAFVPVVGTPLVFASNYGRNYAENLDQDMSESQRVVSALGSAGIEAVIERVGGNPVKWFKGGKNITDETTKNIIKNIIHEAEKSPQQAVKEAAKILGNAFAEEGAEELATGPITDAWNTVVDGVFGNGANGIIAQYEAMKEQNPNLTVGQFLAEKGKEYAEAGLVGGIAGMGMGGTVAGAGAAVGSIKSRAEFKQQQDKAYEEELAHSPALSRKQWDKQQEELGRGNYKAFQRQQREYAQEQLAGLDQVANERGISREEAYEQVVQANRKQKQGETLSEEETNLLNQFEQGANNKWQEHHLEHISNKEDGNIIYAQTPQQEDVCIVKGHVEYRTDSEGNTTFDEENSDAYVYVRYNNTGAVKQVPLAELQYTTHQSVEDTKRDLARLQQFTPGTTIYMVDGNGAIMMAPNGEPATTTIKGVTQDGIVITIGENEVETVIPREEALKQFRTEEEIESIIPQETSTGVAQEGEVEVDNVGEQPSPTPSPITQEQPQPSPTLQSGTYVNPKGEEIEIEVLENGNVNMRSGEQVVENVPVETAQNLIANAGFTAKGQPEVTQPVISQLEQDIADAEEFMTQGDNDYVADNITQAQKRVEQASKRKPKSTDKAQRLAELQSINQEKAQAQAELDRWMKVQEEMDKRRIQATLANERSNTPQGEQDANVAQENVSQQWNNAPKIEGRKDVRTLPNGTQISGRYVLVGDGAATPSHNPLNGWATSEGFPVNERGQNVNDRDYRNDKNAQMETERIAANYGGQAVENVPTVSPEGVVYDGNGRVMAGMIAAQNGTDQAYIDALKQKAEMFGFTEEQVDSIPHARVLFVTDEVLPYTTETFAQFNQNEKKTQGSTETAVSKSKSLNDETRSSVLSIMDRYDSLQGFFNSSDGGVDVLKTLQDNGVIGFADMAALTEEIDGKVVLSAQGRDFVTNVLIGSLFSEEVIRMMGNDRGLKQSILRALPAIIENRKLGEYALAQDIENAIQLLYEARNANMPFILYLRQGNAFEGYVHERFSAFEMLLAEEMSAGVEQFRQVLTLYNTSAINEANGQTSMFGVRSPEDIKNEILDRYGKQSSERQSKQSRPSNQETESAVQGTQPSDEEEVSGNRRLSKEGEVVDAESEEASQRIEDNSEPTSTEEPIAKKLAQEADAFVKAMGGKGVHIVNDVEELPGSEGMAYRAIKSGEKVMGWYNLANDQVYIYTPNANDEQEVFETLLHEFVAHKGLRDLMGHRNFDNMCKNVWSMMDSNRRLQFALYVKESLAIGSTGMLERINAMSEQEKKDYLDELSDRDCLAAADEFIAHFAEYGVSEEERNIWQKIVDTIRQWLRDVGFIVGISEREIAQLLAESHNRLTRNMTIGEMAEAVMRSKLMHERMNSGVNMGFQMEEAEDVATLNKAGEQLNDKGVLFNIRSNPQVVAARDRQLKRSVRNGVLSQDEAQDIRDFAESITEIATAVANAKEDGVAQFPSFSMWNGLEVRMNAEGKPVVSVIKYNSEYPMNIDFAKDCVKRTALNNVMDVLADRAPWIFNRLTMDNLVVLNDIIKDHGLQVPCVGCFVESKRYRSADYARTVVDVWNKAVEAIQNGTEKDFLKNNQKISEKRIIEYLQKNPQEAIVLSEADIVSPTRYGKLMIEHPEIPILLQQTQGQNNVQLVVPEAIYFGEVLDKQDWSIDEAYSVGGVRMQSFSDFKPKLFFDYCQVLADLSAKRLPAHSYTKVNSFAELFGKTGMKINLSLYFEGRGVDENGEYTYSAESIDPDFAYELQDKEGYTENVGTMAIGLSDEHIWKMLKDPKIRSISPYHKSGINPTVAARLNAEQFTDYTNEQNTCTPATAREEGESWQDYYHRITARVNGKVPNVGKKVDNVGFNMYDSLLDTDNPAQTAKDYVAYCQANGMVPKYASFVYNEDGSFNEEYYKLLFDFSVTDRNGNYAPQKAVTWREGSMPENTAELLKTYLSEEEKATQAVRAEIEPIVDEVMDALGEGTRFRIRNSGYAERDNGTAISKRALKAEENGIRFRTTYHGSASDFAKFDHSFMGTGEGLQSFGWGTYVTEVEDVAKRYANVALKGEQKFKYIGDKDVKKSIVKDAEGLIDNAGGFDEALQMYEGHRLPPHYPLAIAFDFIRSTSKSDWEGQRHMYEVEIPDANEAYYIDYKERMSNQGEIFTMVDNALWSDGWKRKEVDDKVVFSDGLNRIVLNPKQTGGDFYNELAFGLGSPQAASEYLNDVVGITGIQYDVNYHNGGNEDGTKNYVIFNADDAKVVSNTRFSIRGNAWSDVPAYNPGETIGEYIQRVNAWKQERNVMAQKEYEEFLNQQGTRMNRMKQQWIDRYSPIEDLLNMLTAKGVKIDPYDNAYTYMMLSGGKAQWDTQEFQRNQVKRMADAFNAIINSNSLDDLAESMTWRNMPDKHESIHWWNPKSLTRRYTTELNNRPLTVRELIGVYLQAKDVEEAKTLGLVDRGEAGFVNNLGRTYSEIINEVEARLDAAQKDELFASVKAANQFSLDYLYQHGMMDKVDYDEYSKRAHYVPERGWRERDMENREMDYVSEQNISSGSPYNSAVIQAKGRGSLASDPIGYIVSIGNSAIMSAQKNEAKKYFLDLMMENEELFRESGIGVFKKYWVKQEVDTDGNVSYVATYVPPTKGEMLKDNATKERIKALQADMYGLRDDLDRQKAILSNLINRRRNMTMDGSIAIMNKGIDAVNAKINRIKNEMSNIEQEIELRKKQIVFVSGVSEDMVQRTAQEKRQHVVYVMKDGQKYELLLENNERLANALNRNFPTPRVGGVIDRVGRGTRYVSVALTQYNPEFAMSNFLRDVQSAMVSNEANFGKEFTARFAKNLTVVPPILCSYMAKRNQGENDLFGNDELSGYLKEFFEEGAPTGYTYLNDVNELAGLFDEMLQTGKTSKKMLETAKNAGSFLSELSELTTRFAQFVTARQSGYTPRQSAIIAKEVSTNFDRKGTMSSNMGIYAFFNASVQGTYKFFHDKKYLDKNWQKASAAKLMAVSGIMFIAGMLATLLNPDDPEDETMHSEYTRKTNYVIGRVKIPVAHFFRIFYGAGTELALAMQGNKTYANALFDTMDFTMQEVMPIGSLPLSYNREQSKAEVDASKFLLSLVPTYGASTMEALVNQDFRGASIYTPYYTTQDAEHMKRIHQSRKGTPLVYDAIAKGLHWLSGGNPEYEVKEPGMRGIIDVPGSTIQHIVHPFIPGAVIMLGDGISAGISAAKGEKVDAGDVPFARRVVTHDYNLVRDFNGEYWELKGKMEHFEKMYKDGQRFSEEEMQLARRVLGVMEDYDAFYKQYKKQRKSGYDGNFGEYLHEAANYNSKNLQVLHNLNKEWNRTMY